MEIIRIIEPEEKRTKPKGTGAMLMQLLRERRQRNSPDHTLSGIQANSREELTPEDLLSEKAWNQARNPDRFSPII